MAGARFVNRNVELRVTRAPNGGAEDGPTWSLTATGYLSAAKSWPRLALAMAISREEVERVAALARLELTDAEKERFREQLSAVLERAQRIHALPLDDLPPTAHPLDLKNVWRDDVTVPFDATEGILENAPDRAEAFFRVPPILGDAE